jgi:hypothetical protein
MSKWSFGGVELDTLGVVTLVSDSLKLPEKRGENLLIPFMAGRAWVEKEFDQRSMTLGLEVIAESIQDLETRMDFLKKFFGRRALGLLRQTLEDLTSRSCYAEYTGDLSLTRISPVSVRMALDFTMPEPFFRSSVLTSDEQTIDESPKTYTLNNPGSAEERGALITLTGPLANPEITNTTNGVSVKYNAAITSGHYVVIGVDSETGEYSATDDLSANVIGNVSHSGSAALMVLDAGDNAMSVTDEVATTGTVKFEFYAPWL